jgi:hypothetical protein
MTNPIESTPTLVQQRDNLAQALSEAGLAYLLNDVMVIMQFTMENPEYVETLNAINIAQKKLFDEGKMIKGTVNYTRGPARDEEGNVYEDQEQIVWFFGTDEEFEIFREQLYPGPFFRGVTK